ncbi:hypothetical protein ASC77_22035 [Nocardioides sp. Root1257]|uniref:hypothetical protein n=1 Tax=unclassified Nocardioides TaxID=2615069 RepID=UPI0006FA54D9|nr:MULTISPECIES: hypothetical protein [unclassified Nocardioides]KQW42985.1 hypothetical protein ASC77_22035 [Nocardioides sp. Root1257]KRC41854.1 hypothetical protein ASE24_21830 [Nocardioides sp. Root224]
MRTRRFIGSLLATAVAASTVGVAVTSAPASAATTVQTRIVSGSSGKPVISSYSKSPAYGDSLSISVNVEALIDGTWQQIYNGPVSVTEQVTGTAARAVASSTSAYVYDSVPAHGRAVYTVSYGGGTGGYPEYTYAPSSASYSVTSVQRKLSTSTLSGKHAGFKGKISPAKKLKIVVFKKHGKKFKKFKTLKTSKSGRFTVVLPAPRRGKFFWRVVFTGDKRFAPSVIQGNTYKL